MTVVIQLRRDTAAQWIAINPVLAAGEPGLESDTGRIKFGDGSTAWRDLAYFLGHVDDTADASKPVSSAQAGAIAARQPLDSDLSAVAALMPAADDLLQYKAGVWSNRTPDQVKIDLALTPADVGLASVDNTADVNKPVSAAQATLVAGAITDHRVDPGAHPHYVPYAVHVAAIANLQAQLDALTAGGSAPMNIAPPSISGDAVVGSVLSVSTGTWRNRPTGFKYQWRLGANNIPDAATATYVATAVGTLTCAVTAGNGSGATSAVSAPVTVTAGGAAPTNTERPTISGVPAVGNTLTCSTGTWTNSPATVAYQWLRGGMAVPGATAAAYQTVTADVGPIACRVTAVNAIGAASITSPPVTVIIAQNSSPSNPVTSARAGIRTFDVGPGQTYEEPDTVPWGSLTAGDVVNIYYRATPYAWKIGLRGQGTAANPIVVNGVTDANGNRPVFQFAGARTASGSNPGGADNVFTSIPEYGESLGGIVIKRGPDDDYFTYKPQWIEIRNLEVTGASNATTYTTLAGGSAAFGAAAGIYVQVGRDILIENCVATDNGFGVFTMAKDELLSQACERVTVRSCRVFGNGIAGSWFEHNFYMQCANPLIEGNFIGQTRSGSLGSSYKSRASGEIFRYNYVEASARACDWVHAEEQSSGIAAQADYGTDFAYGNVIVNDFSLPNGGAYAPIHYGGDNQGEQEPGQPVFSPTLAYRSQLYFFQNTVINRDPSGQTYRIVVFDVSIVSATIDAWNNIVACGGAQNFSWMAYAGTLNLRGMNLASGAIAPARPEATTEQYSVNQLGWLLTSDPLFSSAAAHDYSIQSGSPAIDMSTAAADLPDSVLVAHPIAYQPRMRTNGLAPRPMFGSAFDLGASEFDPSAGGNRPPANIVPPVISGSPHVGVTLTCSTGTWSGLPAMYEFRWIRSGVPVGGATGSSRLLSPDDIGSVTCVVIATNASGSTGQISNSVTVSAGVEAPVNILLPAISGTLVVGGLVAASIGTWTNAPTTYTYHWTRAGAAIAGATNDTYRLVPDDRSTDIAVIVTAGNAAGFTSAASLASHVPGPSADPDANGVFNFSAPNGRTLAALSGRFQPSAYAADFECQSGSLQCVGGTGFYGAVVRYENGQGPNQQSTLVRTGGVFPNGGELGVCVQVSDGQGGYGAWFSEATVQLRRQSPADVSPICIDQVTHDIDWSAEATLRIQIADGVVTIFANGSARVRYIDEAPLTGGFPGFYMVPGANAAAHAATSWTDR